MDHDDAKSDTAKEDGELSFDEQRDVWIKEKNEILRGLGLDKVFLGPPANTSKGSKKLRRQPWEDDEEDDDV